MRIHNLLVKNLVSPSRNDDEKEEKKTTRKAMARLFALQANTIIIPLCFWCFPWLTWSKRKLFTCCWKLNFLKFFELVEERYKEDAQISDVCSWCAGLSLYIWFIYLHLKNKETKKFKPLKWKRVSIKISSTKLVLIISL